MVKLFVLSVTASVLRRQCRVVSSETVVWKAWNIYYLALQRKSLLIPASSSVLFVLVFVPWCLCNYWKRRSRTDKAIIINVFPGNLSIYSHHDTRLCCHSAAQTCLTFETPRTTACSSALQSVPEFAQSLVHWVGGAIQPSHPLSPPSLPALSLSQHQGLFHWVGFSHQVAKLLELQLQHQSFPWIFRVDFLWNGLVWSPVYLSYFEISYPFLPFNLFYCALLQ